MYDIITFGSATRDVLMSPDEFAMHDDSGFHTGKALCLPFGSKVKVEKLVFASGGGGTNAAVAFARQGFKTACVSVIGKDANGSEILDELRRENVDGKYFQTHHDGLTAYSVVLVGEDGERTILSYKGEGMNWDVKSLPWELLHAKWFFVDSLGGHIEMLERITSHAKEIGAHLATNPGGQELELGIERLAPIWKNFDIVGMNQEEAAVLTGISYEEPEQIFQKLDDQIGGVFIMTQGSQGVMVSDGRNIFSAGIPNSEVVERTGAGDAFHAGFIAEFIRSGSIEKSIQLGTANASSVVMQFGAKAGILRKGDIGPWQPVQVSKKLLQ
jgi:ribokinase